MSYFQDYHIGQAGIMFGFVTASVTAIGEGKEYSGKIKVRYEVCDGTRNQTEWVRVLSPYANSSSSSKTDFGFYLMPEIGARVVVTFLNGDRNDPLVIGTLYSNRERKIPEGFSEVNNSMKLFRTIGGNEISFNDKDQSEQIKISTKTNNIIILDENKKSISIGNKANEDNIENSSAYISVGQQNGEVVISAKTSLKFKVGDNTTIEMNSNGITINASTFEVKATQQANISSNATATISGQSMMEVKSSSMTKIGGSTISIG